VPTYGSEIVTKNEYDERHRLVDVYENFESGHALDAEHTRTQLAYDDAGNLTSVSQPLGRTTSYEYDLLNRPVRLIEADPDGAGSAKAPVSHLVYNTLGQLAVEVDPRGAITRYLYNDHHRLAGVMAAHGVTTRYAYDELSRPTEVRRGAYDREAFDYDAAGSLQAARRGRAIRGCRARRSSL